MLLEVEAINAYPIRVDFPLFHVTSSRRYKYEMIQSETKIHRHELSVALAKARLFRCYKTHVDCTWYQKKRSRKEEEEHKNKKEHKKYTLDSMW